MKIAKWIVKEPTRPSKQCVVALPGRGVPAKLMFHVIDGLGLTRSLRIALEPKGRAWYPMPKGANDQEAAVIGLGYAREEVLRAVSSIEKGWGIKKEDIVFVGFSAGSVVALNVVTETADPFAACISLSGAILEPDTVCPAAHQTPIILQHNGRDNVFEWQERYLPMREALERNNYRVIRAENPMGEHNIYRDDIQKVAQTLKELLR